MAHIQPPSPLQAKKLAQFVPASLVSKFCQGVHQFNCGEYFESHETLELVWREQEGAERELTQGIIQIAVACHHLERNNKMGALKLFKRGLARVRKFETRDTGLCLTELCSQVQNLISADLADKAADNFSHPALRFA